MDHYLTRLQNATRKYWNKSALNTLGGESFTYSQMATLIEKFHIFFDKAGLQKGQHIALWARNSARWGMSYLAVNTYEAVIVPILADFHSGKRGEPREPFGQHGIADQRRQMG